MSAKHDMKAQVRRYLEIRSAYNPVYNHHHQEVLFLSTMSGLPQVWSIGKTAPWPKQLTFFSDRIMGLSGSPTQDCYCFWSDRNGDERSQLYLMDHSGENIRPLSENKGAIYRFGAWSPNGKRFSYSTNQRNRVHFDLYEYNLTTSSRRLLYKSDHTNRASQYHPSGQSLLFSRSYTNANHDYFLLSLTDGKKRLLTPHQKDALYLQAQFTKKGDGLFLLSNYQSEFTRVAHLSLHHNQWSWLTEDQWDAEDLTLSKDGNWLAFSKNEQGSSQLQILHIPSHAPVTLSTYPSGVIRDLHWRSNNALLFSLSSPSYAKEIWMMDLKKPCTQRITYASISGPPASTFVTPHLVHYPSFDKRFIPAFYYRPNESNAALPVIIWMHGGPESQSRNEFNSLIQFFLSQGFAVFVPNVRGSSGYGRTYEHLDDRRQRMDTVKDLAAGVTWLTQYGNARKKSIGVFGGSYGGFMVLAALTHLPNLWAGGVDIVGIANLRTFIENTSPYRRHLRESEYGSIEKEGDFFDAISPIHHVEKIQAPLFVIHGANDPRVPVDEAEQIVAALRKGNQTVSYLRFEDEGHGIVKLNNRVQAYEKITLFLKKWLQS